MRLFGIVLCLVATFATALAASPDWLRPDATYSAIRTMKMGGREISGPVHYDKGKERFEMTVEGTQQIMIRREDKGRLYMVMPQMGMGMEMKVGGPEAMPSADDYAKLEPENLGRESLDGEEVTKYRIVAKEAGQDYTVLIWATDDGIPLRMEGSTTEGNFETVLTNLERDPQPAELFELPAGIQMMTVPGQ